MSTGPTISSLRQRMTEDMAAAQATPPGRPQHRPGFHVDGAPPPT